MDKIDVIIIEDDRGKPFAKYNNLTLEINSKDVDSLEIGKKYSGYIHTVKLSCENGDRVILTSISLAKSTVYAKSREKHLMEGVIYEKRTNSKYAIEFDNGIAILDRKSFANRTRKDFFQTFSLTEQR